MAASAHVSLLKLFGLNSYAFAYFFICSTMGLLVLPKEALRMFPERHALYMGLCLGLVGITQLISPVAGYLSDRSTSLFGKRRPYMISGGAFSLLGLGIMFLARERMWPVCYIVSLGVATCGMNVCYAAYTNLIPDFVIDKHQMVVASGAMAMTGLLGSATGFAVFSFYVDVFWCYLVYGVLTAVTIGITSIVARERQQLFAEPVVASEIKRCYVIDRTTHSDFFWVLIIRTLYYTAVSVQAFILYFVRDITRASDDILTTGVIVMAGQTSAVLIAMPAGRLSDAVGRKPLVQVACVIMAAVYVSFLNFTTRDGLFVIGFIYGVGNGLFIPVDYALVCDTIQDKQFIARDLGVWGIASFIGSTLGPLLYGPILWLVGFDDIALNPPGDDTYHYKYLGYVIILSLACAFTLAAGMLTHCIQSVR